MPTVFDDPLFKTTDIKRVWKFDEWMFRLTLRSVRGNYLADLIRQDSKGSLTGRIVKVFKNDVELIDVYRFPDWVIPGTMFNAVVQDSKVSLLLESSIQSRIEGLSEELGDKHTFSYQQVSEFTDQ